MQKAASKFEAILILIVGLGMVGLVWFGDYWRFMNPKFMWLTAMGGVLLIIIGDAAFFADRRFKISRIIFFTALLVIIAFSKPWTQIDSDVGRGELIRGSRSPNAKLTLGGKDYERVTAPNLYMLTWDEGKSEYSGLFAVFGMVKKSPELSRDGHFAVVGPMIWCCLADASALGFRVPYDRLDELEDGQWVEVLGVLKKLDTKLKSPELKIDMVFYTSVSEDHILIPDKVVIKEKPTVPYFYN